jgi:hypothetical protein
LILAKYPRLESTVAALFSTRRAFVAVLGLGLFTMAARGVTDPDVWWHLRTGQLMWQSRCLFHTDPYSFTRLGQPWVNHEWLSEILIFLLYRVSGFGGLIAGSALVIAATQLLVFSRCAGRPYLAALMTLWGAVASAPAWGVRPQMLSLLLGSIFLVLLEASGKRPSLLWWTAPLMLLWVNLHAGYPIGLAFLALFLLGEALESAVRPEPWTSAAGRLKSLALALAVCLGLVAVNPNGLRIYSYPFETLRSPAMQKFIQEWFSPDFHDLMYLPLLLLLLALIAGLALSPGRPRLRDLMLLLATVPAGLRSMRHIPILVLVVVPVLAGVAETWLQQRGGGRLLGVGQHRPSLRIVRTNVLVLITATVLALLRVRQVIRTQSEAEAQHFPRAAAAFLGRERPPGPILNHYNFGGYFIWTLYPQYRVFTDGRADVYGDQFMNDFAATYYFRGDVRTLVLPPDAPLITALRASPDWREIYADSEAVILTRRQ